MSGSTLVTVSVWIADERMRKANGTRRTSNKRIFAVTARRLRYEFRKNTWKSTHIFVMMEICLWSCVKINKEINLSEGLV